MVIIYESPTRFGNDAVQRLIRDFKSNCNEVGKLLYSVDFIHKLIMDVGMTFKFPDVDPLVKHCPGQGRIVEVLSNLF